MTTIPMLQNINDHDQEIQMRFDLSVDDDIGDDAGDVFDVFDGGVFDAFDGEDGDDESVRGSIEWAA